MNRLTLSEMSERLHRSTKTFRKYVLQYDIPHIRLGRDLLFDEKEVVAHLQGVSDIKRERRTALAVRVKRGTVSNRFAEKVGI